METPNIDSGIERIFHESYVMSNAMKAELSALKAELDKAKAELKALQGEWVSEGIELLDYLYMKIEWQGMGGNVHCIKDIPSGKFNEIYNVLGKRAEVSKVGSPPCTDTEIIHKTTDINTWQKKTHLTYCEEKVLMEQVHIHWKRVNCQECLRKGREYYFLNDKFYKRTASRKEFPFTPPPKVDTQTNKEGENEYRTDNEGNVTNRVETKYATCPLHMNGVDCIVYNKKLGYYCGPEACLLNAKVCKNAKSKLK